jgi:peptidoglycan/LPS O-acetylase OafA/YrhL
MAVQVFLVMGGYLAASSLTRQQQAGHWSWLRLVWQRYVRLIGPLLVALLLVSVCAAFVRPLFQDDFIPAPPTWPQVLSHLLLLQDLLGMPALSAGVWYVAIDFQLYALLAGFFWLGQRFRNPQRVTLWLVLVCMAASLFYVNRQIHWDAVALYYFGSYGLGVLAFWVRQAPQRQHLLIGTAVVVGLALFLEWRLRLFLALLTMLLLCMQPASNQLPPQARAWLIRLSDASYGQFLTHFVVVMLVNTLVVHMPALQPGSIAIWMLVGTLLSLGLGLGFHRWVERPLSGWLRGQRSRSIPSGS